MRHRAFSKSASAAISGGILKGVLTLSALKKSDSAHLGTQEARKDNKVETRRDLAYLPTSLVILTRVPHKSAKSDT